MSDETGGTPEPAAVRRPGGSELVREVEVRGPWSLAVSRRFWEGFSPNPLQGQQGDGLSAVFLCDFDWRTAGVRVDQIEGGARLRVSGDGDLDAAAAQVLRVLALDVDGTGWADVAKRDAVIAEVQHALPGFRPCGFYSPYEAAAWTVLSQRVRMTQAAVVKQRITEEFGEAGAFPAPAALRGRDLGLPGRKNEYLDAVCEAALDGLLDGAALRRMDADNAIEHVEQIKGLGPFAAGLVVVRGANHPDALPHREPRLESEVERRYGSGVRLVEVAAAWRPYRTWAAVGLRALAP